MDVPQRLNGKELSREEFQYNLLIWYDIVVLNLSTDCDVSGKKLLLPHDLSDPKGVLVLSRHDDAATELGALAARALNPLYKSYEPKINSRTVQGQRNRYG